MELGELSYFPTPYPDEDFRSIVYRYHIRSINTEIVETNLELFGLKSYKNTFVPRNLSILIERLPKNNGISAENLVEANTLFPLFRHFLSKDKLQKLWDDMMFKTRKNTNNSLTAVHGNRTISEFIRYCPVCLANDYEKYGETYVHRIHQLHFFDTCNDHIDVKLISHCPECAVCLSKGNAEALLTHPHCPNGHLITSSFMTSSYDCELQKEMYADVVYLLNYRFNGGLDEISVKLKEWCWNKGYYNYSGYLNTKFKDDLLEKYQDSLLIKIGYSRSYINSATLLRNLVNSNRRLNNIILYILVMRFFAGSVEQFLENHITLAPMSNPIPFGSGPWTCINKICESFQKPSIKQRKLLPTRSNYIYSSEFICPNCNMGYALVWDWRKRKQVYLKITDMGPKLKEKLFELYIKGYTVKNISSEIGVGVTCITKTLKQLLGIYYSAKRVNNKLYDDLIVEEIMKGIKETAVTSTMDNKIEKYKEKILLIIKENPSFTRYQIFKASGGIYNIVMKFDKEWIEGVLPISSKLGRNPDLDIQQLDVELCYKVENKAKQLYKNNPNTRIKKYSIINTMDALDKGRLLTYGERLPLTEAMLIQYVESRENYLSRHLPRIVSYVKAAGQKSITIDSIISLRYSYRNLSSDLRIRLERQLRDILG